MAGKHRKLRRRRSSAQPRWIPSLTAAAVGATSLTTALTTGTTVTVASPAVELTALITPANSTAQIFAGSDYYNQDWSVYGSPQVVPFFLGPQGIVAAIDSNADPNAEEPNIVVLSSGWGAGQTGTALAIMKANNDPAMDDIKLMVLDNNSNRAGGGFWTTYWMFAPLLLTSAEPTPSDTDVPVLDVAYEYNINSSAPTYPINLFSSTNSLVAYLYGYGGEATAPVPQELIDNPPDPGDQHYHYILNEDGSEAQAPIPVDGNITYVTFKSDRLPLVKPLLLIPGGELVADAVEPTLTVLVNAGYKDNQPIPDDPGQTRPVGLFPSAAETATAVNALPGALQNGAQDAQQDLSSSSSTVTSPQSNVTNQVQSRDSNSQNPSLQLPLKPTTSSTRTVDMTNGFKFFPDRSRTSISSSSSANNPVERVIGSVTAALGGLANNPTHGAENTSGADTPSGSAAPSN